MRSTHAWNSGWFKGLGITIGGAFGAAVSQTFALSTNCALAQITPDDTLPNNSRVTTQDNIRIIEGGTKAGSNLFHSFREFSVPTGGTAFFNNGADIQNIISRVTGGAVSNIDGLIRASGTANLFLINPSGIIFGQNARLDIGGSFLASTASSMKFADGFEFSATPSLDKPLLTITAPIGLGMGRNPGEIQVRGSGYNFEFQDIKQQPRLPLNSSVPGLGLVEGKTIALVGGKVSLEGGVLKSSSGRIEIGSVGSNGTVNLVPIQEGWKLGYESTSSFGDIQFSGRSLVDTTGVGGGSIAVAGRNISLNGQSILLADTLGDRNGGEISIVGDEISVIESDIKRTTFSLGNAGQVKLIANKSILLENEGGVGTNTQGLGKAGEITLKADSIEVRKNSGLGSNTYGAGNAGWIEVQANSLLIEKGSGFGTFSNGKGDAGKISITANSLLIEDSAGFNTATEQGSTGQGGEINVNITGSLVVRNNAGISGNTSGAGNAGKISITANSLLIEDSAGFNTATEQGSTGQGGEINVNITGSLIVRKNAGINSNSKNTEDAGQITVSAKSLEISNNSGIATTTTGSGNAGNINVRVKTLFLDNNARFQLESKGSGNAGTLKIMADTIKLDNQSLIDATTTFGNGGDFTLDVANLLLLRHNSQISTSAGTAQAGGNGGNITINAQSGFIVAVPNENSDITANAFSGKGGRITINATGIFGMVQRSRQDLERFDLDSSQLQTNDITAISQTNPSLSGTIELNTPDIDLNSGLINLPEVPVDTKVAQTCTEGSPLVKSQFTITGRGGLPSNPGEVLNTDAVRVDLVTLNPEVDKRSTTVSTNPTSPTPDAIVEATGWVIDADGNVVLTANPTTITPHSSWQKIADCRAFNQQQGR